MELGIYTFGELTSDPATGKTISAQERFANLLEEIELADQLGLDVFGVGEHHRRDFIVSAPAVILAAAATRTKNIKLTSAVSVLSSDDPVRVYQQFATLDLLSKGRAEIMAGRGSFIESFPLFGYNLEDYNILFEEKLELLLKIRDSEKVTWTGTVRPAINNLSVYPRSYNQKLPVWVAVGGTPESVVRAANHGLPLALAIIGGMPSRFTPLIQLYREAAIQTSFPSENFKVSINSHGFIAEDSQKAADEYYGPYSVVMSAIGRERGWPPTNRQQYDAMRSEQGSLLVGSPQQVIDKILYEYDLFKMDRFLLQFSVGTMPHKSILRSIELFGEKVAPVIKKELSHSDAH
ncbi:MAG: LLM class flavin-dependent oxidoreductase [Calditrichaeota bacterium]|nr:LLM class flavin-dependent oxidoreductase [Calditrichota bacterium]